MRWNRRNSPPSGVSLRVAGRRSPREWVTRWWRGRPRAVTRYRSGAYRRAGSALRMKWFAFAAGYHGRSRPPTAGFLLAAWLAARGWATTAAGILRCGLPSCQRPPAGRGTSAAAVGTPPSTCALRAPVGQPLLLRSCGAMTPKYSVIGWLLGARARFGRVLIYIGKQ